MASVGLTSVEPTEDRLGIQCHDGQKRRQRVRSNLPSGAPNGRNGDGASPVSTLMNPPRGMPGGARPGGSHRLFPSTPEGWFPVMGRRQVTLALSLAPSVCGRSLLQEVCKKCSGMLNVLPYMVPVKREIQHLVALQGFKGFTLKPGLMRWLGCDLLVRRGPRAGRGRRTFLLFENLRSRDEAAWLREARRYLRREPGR